MTEERKWEEEFDKEFTSSTNNETEPYFTDPNGQVGPVKAYIRELRAKDKERLLEGVEELRKDVNKLHAIWDKREVWEGLAQNKVLDKIKELINKLYEQS